MNNKGFMMAEVVVVSSIVLVTLVGLYTSYNKIFSIYNQRVSYYDVVTLYELANIRNNTDLSSLTSMTSISVVDTNKKVYFVNKEDIEDLEVSNQTFKDYLDFLSTSLDFDNMNINGESVNNILVMEKCDDNKTNCKYAYLEVPDEAS